MRTLTTIMALLLAGCSMPQMPTLRAHKIDIQQGNYVTQDMVARLKPGMTRSQVRYALGTPLIVDPFRTDRWDYFYMLYQGGELKEQRVVTVVFRGDVLDRIEGDVVVAADAAAKPAAAAAEARPAPAAAPPEAMPMDNPAAATEKK
jgi:outer membrane protein assembly factor BamE